jgi:plasmid stabilization system protein ParE
MKIRILPSAYNDLMAGFRFYESQSVGLGNYFSESLLAEIDSLYHYRGIHGKHHGFFRLLARRFPYAVYYTIETTHVLVWRILDMRSNPDQIRRKLGLFM